MQILQKLLRSKNKAICGSLAYSTDISQFEADVAVLAPASSPGVFYSPVGKGHSNQKNLMVDFTGSRTIIKNAVTVKLPIFCIHCSGHWTHVKVLFYFVTSIRFN